MASRNDSGRRGLDRAVLLAALALAASAPACLLVTSFDDLHPEGAGGGANGGAGPGPGAGASGPGGSVASTGSHGNGGAGAGSSSTSGAGAGGGCSGGDVCAPPPGPGWSEPVVFIETADASASCGGPNPLLTGNTAPSAGPCTGCSCDPPTTCVALATACTDGGCMNCPGGPAIYPNVPCALEVFSSTATRLVVQPSGGGSCQPSG